MRRQPEQMHQNAPVMPRSSLNPSGRRLPLLVLSTFALSLALVLPSSAADLALAQGEAVAAPDFATETYGDPWDFSNPQDALLDVGPTMALESPRIAGGLLSFDMSRNGYLSPLWGGYPGGLYLDREGGNPDKQLDADRYTHFSMHAYVSEATPAGLMWWNCPGLDRECMGGQQFLLRPGWNTYNIAVTNGGFDLPQAWTGMMTGLRLAISPSQPVSVSIDWMRAYEPVLTAEAPRGAVWESSGTGGYDAPSAPNRGQVRCGLAPICDLSSLPPGSYTISTEHGLHSTTTLRRPARPVLLDPDEIGGREYGESNPWDFTTPDDVAAAGNVGAMTFGKRLDGVNGPPVYNDPHVWLPLRDGPVDSGYFHRFTIRSGYEGAFRLEDEPGGGTMGRIVWQPEGRSEVQQSEDVVTYGGTRTVTVDLDDANIHETDHTIEFDRFDWDFAPVHALRWDPNEDPGVRRWWVERVALRADDEAGTSFRVRWYDAGFAPGSTVTLYRDDDDQGFDGTAISGALPQRAGTNVFDWDTSGLVPGSYWVYAVVDGPGGVGRSYSTGPVQAVGPSLQGQTPSPATPLVRYLMDACPQPGVPSAGFPDVSADSVHRLTVDCLAWWGVTRPVNGYKPAGEVTRGQMASFLRRVVERTGGSLPAGGDAFSDDNGDTHEAAINALAAAGLVSGFGDGTYKPLAPVSREQMATFLVRAAEYRLGHALPSPADYFTDDEVSAHQAAIDKAAGAGVTGGTAENRYSPDLTVRRDQMASFLVRLLDLLVASGKGTAPAR